MASQWGCECRRRVPHLSRVRQAGVASVADEEVTRWGLSLGQHIAWLGSASQTHPGHCAGSAGLPTPPVGGSPLGLWRPHCLLNQALNLKPNGHHLP